MIMDLLQPIITNPEEHSMSSNMGQVVIFGMECDTETLRKELEEDELPHEFKDHTLEATDTCSTGNEPLIYHFNPLCFCECDSRRDWIDKMQFHCSTWGN